MDNTSQIQNLNKWFWYYGVLPLVTLYLICINLVAELFQLSLVMLPTRSVTEFYMSELLFWSTLGIASIMIVWCNINAIRVFTLSSKIEAQDYKRKCTIMKISVFVFPILAFLCFIPVSLFFSFQGIYVPLFPIIEPFKDYLTPILYPIYEQLFEGFRFNLFYN